MAEAQLARPGLYLVATPIGNLEDITLRALRVLRQADLIACEDTRQTRKLLNHYGIQTPTVSYHQHNELTRAPELLVQLQQGRAIALVSDAGMPAISDPGYRLITLAIHSQIPIIPIPGPAALLAALAASGLATDSFRFSGFLPARAAARRNALEEVRHSPSTHIFYEAPHRLRETLTDIAAILGPERPLVVARELTKLHEEFLRGRARELLALLAARQIKGEITLLVGKSEDRFQAQVAHPAGTSDPAARLRQIMRESRLDERAALKALARELGISKSEAYRRAKLGSRS